MVADVVRKIVLNEEARRMLANTVRAPGGCRLWTKAIQSRGYGVCTVNGKPMLAHRRMYQLVHGDIPPKHDVCHRCDIRHCIAPRHVFAGTRLDNMRDAVRKGRQARGFMMPHTKLGDADKQKILARVRSGEIYRTIANDFDIHATGVCRLATTNGLRRSK